MTIHFFSAAKLVDDIVHERLSQRDKAYYMLSGFIFNIIAGYSTLMLSSASRTWAGAYECILLVVITIYGFERCYAAASGEKNAAFISNFICLSLPIGITTTVGGWCVFWGWWLLYRSVVIAVHIESQDAIKIIDWINHEFLPISVFLTVGLCNAIFYRRMISHLRATTR